MKTFSGLNTPEIKYWGDIEGNAFAVKPVSAGNHVGGKLAVDFTLESEQKVYISIGINADTASAYIDNIELVNIERQETGLVNGDFETGDLTGYIYSYGLNNFDADDLIKVIKENNNNRLFIPSREESQGGAKGRFINQKVTLPAGAYRLSFEADILFTDTSDTQPFIFTVSSQIDYGFERALTSVDGATAKCLSTSQGLDTPVIKNYGDKTGNAFAVKSSNDSNHVGGIIAIDFVLQNEQTVFVSIGINGSNASAYIDNIKLKRGSSFHISVKSFQTIDNCNADTKVSIYNTSDNTVLYDFNLGYEDDISKSINYLNNGSYIIKIEKNGHKTILKNIRVENTFYTRGFILELLGNDVTGDNKVDIKDLIYSKKYALGELTGLSNEQKELFDHNEDNTIGDYADLETLKYRLMTFKIDETNVSYNTCESQSDYFGLSGTLPCYWYLPDSTLKDGYSNEEIQKSMDRILQMGVSVVRTHNFQPGYA